MKYFDKWFDTAKCILVKVDLKIRLVVSCCILCRQASCRLTLEISRTDACDCIAWQCLLCFANLCGLFHIYNCSSVSYLQLSSAVVFVPYSSHLQCRLKRRVCVEFQWNFSATVMVGYMPLGDHQKGCLSSRPYHV